MRIFHVCRIYGSVLNKAIICTLLMLLLMNYLKEPNLSKTATVKLDVVADINTTQLNALTAKEMEALNAQSDDDAKALNAPSDEAKALNAPSDEAKALNTPGYEERIGNGKALSYERRRLNAPLNGVMKALNSANDKERVDMLYDLSVILMDFTHERFMNLKDIIHHLRILKTRPFSKTVRPDTCDGCMAYNFKNMINPTHICQGDEEIELFIMVTTIPKEHEERSAVRNTWASLTNKNTAGVRYLFLFGGGFSDEDQRIIDRESNIHKDILQEDFIDNYYNLAYKAIMGYRWVTANCPGAKYIMRTACDNFIHIPKVLTLLRQNQTRSGDNMEYAQLGTKIKDLRILRSPQRKWYITANDLSLNWTVYHDYCIGTVFVFHRNAAIKFLNASPNVPFFVIEDAYFGMVMKTIDMPAANVPGFTVEASAVGLPSRSGCPNKGQWYSIHQAKPSVIHQLWEQCEKHWALPKSLV